MEAIRILFSWMPGIFSDLALGAIVLLFILAILTLIGKVWDSLPFF